MKDKKVTYKERRAQKKKDFKRGYIHGYEDALKSLNGNIFRGTVGYKKGFKDSRNIINVKNKYNNYKNSL